MNLKHMNVQENSSVYFLSIIIPVFNAVKSLEFSLNAIFNCDYKNVEVIVIDDASTDGSVEIARKFSCRIIEKKTNTGAADCRNLGAKMAQGNILVFIDADCIVKENTLTEIIESFKKGFDIVAGTYSKTPFNPQNIFSHYHSLFCFFNYTNTSVALFGTHCAAIKKSVFMEIGGFDHTIKGATIEDLKFQYKIQSLNYKWNVNMNAQVMHYSRNALTDLVSGYFKRSKFSVKLILNIDQFTPSREGYILNYKTLASYLAIGISFSAFFLSFFNLLFIWISLSTLVVFFLLRKGFYRFAENKRQRMKVMVLSALCDLSIILGGLMGILSYVWWIKEKGFKCEG